MKDKQDIKAIQFNGWNFGYIYDWYKNAEKAGMYPALFYETMTLGDTIVKRNEWIIKNDDGTFSVKSNLEFQNSMQP